MVGGVRGRAEPLRDRCFGSILPDIRQNTPKTAITDDSDRGTCGERGPDLRHHPRRPLDHVVPGLPQHRPISQRNRVPPAPVTAKPLGAPTPGPAIQRQPPAPTHRQPSTTANWRSSTSPTMRPSPTVTQPSGHHRADQTATPDPNPHDLARSPGEPLIMLNASPHEATLTRVNTADRVSAQHYRVVDINPIMWNST